ncbi:metal-dependent hydrolase [Paludifilum halophilum]|uniref:Metal-dependent hydrolase n=2 Tax=Paludifilum halophilum TaxID=1642702 RepID=A0A235B241_9BACL|nr:metal-dependent hydrolase [Paludifilum halophilum]
MTFLFFPVNIEKARAGPQQTLRVMSYNIHAGIGWDQSYDLDRIARVIRESEAEVVGLQEVDVHWGSRSRFENGIEILAQKLNMNVFFAPIYSRDGQPPREFGVAVLTEYPILDARNHEITRLSTQEPDPSPKPAPGFAEVVVNVRGVHLPVYVTHLDYRSDPSIREMQVKDMLNIVSRRHREHLLIGDLNATPEAQELKDLFQKYEDAWASRSDPGYTFPAGEPTKRIDYVLATPGIRVESAHVPNTLASDHRPVIADLTLRRGSPHP